MDTKTILAAVLGGLALVSPTSAQYQYLPGYVTPTEPVEQTMPANDTEESTLLIQARRERLLRNARRPGTPNRMNPMRTFPGYLPEKIGQPWTIDLDGNVLEDARQSQIPAPGPGRAAQPDTFEP